MSFKKVMMVVTAFVLLAALAGSAGPSHVVKAQDENPQRRTITVTGNGVSYGAPDTAYLGLGVEAVNADIAAAMDDTNARMNAVIQALQAAGVAAEDIRTDNFSIYQDYGSAPMPVDSTMSSDQPQRVYRVSNTLNVRVRNPEQIAELLAAAVNAGANVVNYVQFDLADRSALESEARQDAVTDANARAQELAGLLGVTVGEPLNIVEGQNGYPGPMYGGAGGAAMDMAASAPPISQGTLSVNMSVTITYAVQ
jgi:uncharacterized protein YggE